MDCILQAENNAEPTFFVFIIITISLFVNVFE